MGYDFHTNKDVKAARKAYRCEQCGTLIEVGQPYKRHSGVWEGDFYTQAAHPECHNASVAYANLHDLWGETFPFFQHMDDQEPEDWKWCCEVHPIVAKRLGWDQRLAEHTAALAGEPTDA